MPTATITENNYKRLVNLAGKLQVKKSECVSINDVITGMLNLTEKAILQECLEENNKVSQVVLKLTEKISRKDGINEGTKAKASLQLRAIEFLKNYPQHKTLDSFARLLCWDLNICYRTALDSYIMPMYEHGYFFYEGEDKFSFKNGKENKQIKKGKIESDKEEKTQVQKDRDKHNEFIEQKEV